MLQFSIITMIPSYKIKHGETRKYKLFRKSKSNCASKALAFISTQAKTGEQGRLVFGYDIHVNFVWRRHMYICICHVCFFTCNNSLYLHVQYLYTYTWIIFRKLRRLLLLFVWFVGDSLHLKAKYQQYIIGSTSTDCTGQRLSQ